MLPVIAGALVVIGGMMLMATRARSDADRARHAQVVIEHARSATGQVNVLLWRTLAQTRGRPPDTVVAQGLSAYRVVIKDLRELRNLGVSRSLVAAIERRIGDAYNLGLKALLIARRSPNAGRTLALKSFVPAMARLDAAITASAQRQDELARSAQRDSATAELASLFVGLLLLALLGWRVHFIQRGSALAEQARAAERRGEERLRALVRHSSDVVGVIDAFTRVRWIAESVRTMLGYEPVDLIDRQLTELGHADDAHRVIPFFDHAIRNDGHSAVLSMRMRHADGTYVPLEIVAENHFDDPLVAGVLLSLRNVSERLELEEQLRHQAFHDKLTGLANRALFEDHLRQALARLRRHTGAHLAVLFIDLDDFKTVNDSLGHAMGDELLRVVGNRIKRMLRVQDTAARLGGDEFVVLLEDLTDRSEAAVVAERIQLALRPPVIVGGRQLTPSASIGLAYPDPTATAADVLGNADVAMYAAKGRGRGQVAQFEQPMRDRAIERLDLTAELGMALKRGELVLEYQPIVTLETGAVVAVEALIRWEHPTRGRLAPDRFIALAESSGLIVPIGRWVLQTACAQLRRWVNAYPDYAGLEMSVNISARQLADGEFPRHVREVLDETGVAPSQLTLEITERLLIDDSDGMRHRLRALKDLGVYLAVDDFGTGYSALSYMQAFPMDILKIDRTFVSGINHDGEKAHLVQSIIAMGHNLHLRVITEGVEEPGEAALLREFGSEAGQGFLFSPPIDVAAIDRLLATSDLPVLESEAL